MTAGLRDPEGLYYGALLLAYVGEVEGAVALFERTVAGGLFSFPAFARDAWLDRLRTHADFKRAIGTAEARHREAVAAFRAAGGEKVLGISLS